MKKYVFALVALLVFSVFGLSAQSSDSGDSGDAAKPAAAASAPAQSSEMQYYNNLFKYAETTVDRLGVVQQVVDANVADAQDFYASTFGFLIRDFPNIKGNIQVDAANKMCRILAKQLGNGKNQKAGQDLWRAQEEFTDPLVKTDILEALGKMQFPETLPKVVQLLNDLNFNPHVLDGDAEEKTAYGAILSLEGYGDASGYLPVYFASTGWYKDRVKSKAREVLTKLKIDGDPSVELIKVIQSPYPVDSKLTALRNIESSQDIPKESKSKVAVAALNEGWKTGTQNKTVQTNLASMRLLAISMIIEYGTDDAAVYPLLDKSYREGIFPDEQIGTSETKANGIRRGGALNALIALKSDESAKLLEGYLDTLNKMMQNNVLRRNPSSDDWARTRAVIVGLGNIGKASSRQVLASTISMNWTGWIKGLARTAVGKLK